jgi:hypothetical protein
LIPAESWLLSDIRTRSPGKSGVYESTEFGRVAVRDMRRVRKEDVFQLRPLRQENQLTILVITSEYSL